MHGRHLNLQIGGGEPILHPLFPEIVNRLKRNNNYIGVTTNGSRSEEWWAKVLPLDNVTISLHPEFTNIEKINSIGKFILDSGTNLMFNLSCDPANWEKTVALFDDLDNELKPLVSPKVLNYLEKATKENYDYTDEQSAWITQHLTKPVANNKFKNSIMYFSDNSKEPILLGKVTINKWNTYKGWECKAGSQSITINPNGQVYAGICQVKKLGHLSNFELFEDIIVCPFDNCACPTDIRAEKHKVINQQ